MDKKLNAGVLFRNDRKQTEKHPDYTGSFTDANGVEHWLSAWMNESAKGTKYMSISVGSPKEQPAYSAPAAEAVDVDTDADLPF